MSMLMPGGAIVISLEWNVALFEMENGDMGFFPLLPDGRILTKLGGVRVPEERQGQARRLYDEKTKS